jgi:hypothetical protein
VSFYPQKLIIKIRGENLLLFLKRPRVFSHPKGVPFSFGKLIEKIKLF